MSHDMPFTDVPGRDHADVSLEEFAAISVALTEGDQPTDEVLAFHRLTLKQWEKVSDYWSRVVAANEAAADVYAASFMQAQDRRKAVPTMTPEEWAALIVDVAADGRRALERRGLSGADHQRLIRHWASALGHDKALAARYARSFYKIAPRPPR